MRQGRLKKQQIWLRELGVIAFVGVMTVAAGGAQASEGANPPTDEQACSSLQAVQFADATVTATSWISQEFTPPSSLSDSLRGAETGTLKGLPAACRVELTIKPAIKVEVWLPAKQTWNQRFQAVGGGGYAGFIAYDSMAAAIRDGYATASTDTGHSQPLMDGSFALNADRTISQEAVRDFSRRAVHEMTLHAKTLISAYYRRAPRYSYWNGCSTGGRQGLMEAQQYPKDYDGILAGAPAINWDRFIPSEYWPQVVMQEELGKPLDPAKIMAVNKAIIEAYDAADGVRDGVINDPQQVEVSDELLKHAGLDPKEIVAIRKIWAGPVDQSGNPLWFGLEAGAPLNALAGSMPFPISKDYLALWLQKNPAWDGSSINYQKFRELFAQSRREYGAVIGTDSPDLSNFNANGGKLIMWHGWSDQLIFPKGSINYYQRLVAAQGGIVPAQKFARLFMAPGVEHCQGGQGPDQLEGMASLVKWVEHGEAPNQILAHKLQAGGVTLSRPLCPFPAKARYKGAGDQSVSDSYDCVAADMPSGSSL